MYSSFLSVCSNTKKAVACSIAALLFFSLFIGEVNAAYTGPGSKVSAATVASILKNPKEDMPVAMKGHLVRKMKHETYMFSDGSGEIQVDIDDKDFPSSQHIDAKTKVEIIGEVDVERKSGVEIDVKSLKVVP
ncbi:NirD/YgiW/YdeI family stress tolerance protein [Endozoicomonas ascidiicola]|uniref:NirD/YgiW/YdeI family stress tolerance protein n=1 Tax=Endozoicomonas ascidiicola TaxID=1698521 RepID=UPI000A50CAEE|nr:NirD/YgiW/YdeI family stress tolerance protein [Endozoicomonas ascidiicola]